MTKLQERKARFHFRQLGRELAAIGIVKSRADYVRRWLGGGEHDTLDTVTITASMFLSVQFGLALAKMEIDEDLSIERDPDINWMIRAKRLALSRIEHQYGDWIEAHAAFRPDIEL